MKAVDTSVPCRFFFFFFVDDPDVLRALAASSL